MEGEELHGAVKEIIDICYQIVILERTAENNRKLLDLLKKNYQLYGKDSWNILMYIRAQALKNHLDMNQIMILHDACWSMGENSEKTDKEEEIFFKKLAANLKPKTCEIFRGPLSGREVFYAETKGESKSRYSFTKLPGDIRYLIDVRFSISPKNTAAILAAYDALVQSAEKENNGLMRDHWKIQQQSFIFLLGHVAPKLIEQPVPYATAAIAAMAR